VLASADVDAERALADLLELSRDVEAVAILDGDWQVAASNLDAGAAETFARHVAVLASEAEQVKPGADAGLTWLRATVEAGSVFVVREPGRAIAATAPRPAPAALVVHDLRTCLGELASGVQVEKAADAPR
jgi:hypothetical protein